MSLQKEFANRKMTKRSIDSYKKEANVHDACEEGDLEVVRELITTSPSEIWKTDEICYFSALHVAANHGHLEIVKLLLDAGADINRKSKSGETPLHLAVTKNHIDVVKCLLVRGADYSITNFHKRGTYTIRHTPRDVAVEEHLPEIVKLFDNMKVFEKKKEKETIILAAFMEEEKKIKTEFEAAQALALKNWRKEIKKNGNADIIIEKEYKEFMAIQEKETLEFQIKRREEVLDFYKKNIKTIKPPAEIIKPVIGDVLPEETQKNEEIDSNKK
jgi:ankyrin repeat protein